MNKIIAYSDCPVRFNENLTDEWNEYQLQKTKYMATRLGLMIYYAEHSWRDDDDDDM